MIEPFVTTALSGTNTSPNAFCETSANNNGNADMAYFTGSYANTVEVEFSFLATSTTTPPFELIATVPNNPASHWLFNLATGNSYWQYYTTREITSGNSGTLSGYKSSYTVGHTYDVKAYITAGDEYAIKVWDNATTEPAYATLAKSNQGYSSPETTWGVEPTGTSGDCLDDFAISYNGASLPLIAGQATPSAGEAPPPTPTPSPTPSPTPTPSPSPT